MTDRPRSSDSASRRRPPERRQTPPPDNAAEIAEYSRELAAVLRSMDPSRVRAFARLWGERLHNRSLQKLADAAEPDVERRMWMMIRERPDLADLHPRAEQNLADE